MPSWSKAGPDLWGLNRRWRLLGFAVGRIVFVGVCRAFSNGSLRRVAVLGTEHNLPWRSLSLVANHDHVVAGPMQQFGKHVARLSRAKLAKHTLVRSQSLHLGAGGR